MRNNPFFRRWGMPLIMAALTIFGLLSALLGTEAWQALAWLALAVPLLVLVRYVLRGTTARRRP